MGSYKEEITKICKYAIQHANAKGLDYAKNFIDPDNWEMMCFYFKCKKQYIVWNKYYYGAWAADVSTSSFIPFKTTDFPKFIENNFSKYSAIISNTPEGAMEKWIDDLFNGEESLNSVRLHIEITGIS